mgnify:CR=1 FL=1
MRRLLFLVLFLSLIAPAHSENVIYDTITPSLYNYITIDDDLNIKYINDYSYDVMINGSYIGTYKKGDKIFVNDGANVAIYVPKGNINTDTGTVGSTIYTQMFIIIMYAASGLLFVIGVVIIFRKIWGGKGRRR